MRRTRSWWQAEDLEACSPGLPSRVRETGAGSEAEVARGALGGGPQTPAESQAFTSLNCGFSSGRRDTTVHLPGHLLPSPRLPPAVLTLLRGFWSVLCGPEEQETGPSCPGCLPGLPDWCPPSVWLWELGGPCPGFSPPSPPPSMLSPREPGLLEVAGRAEITGLQRFPSHPCPRGDFWTGKGRLWSRERVFALSGGSLAPAGAVRSRGSCLTSLSCVSLISAMGIMESASSAAVRIK